MKKSALLVESCMIQRNMHVIHRIQEGMASRKTRLAGCMRRIYHTPCEYLPLSFPFPCSALIHRILQMNPRTLAYNAISVPRRPTSPLPCIQAYDNLLSCISPFSGYNTGSLRTTRNGPQCLKTICHCRAYAPSRQRIHVVLCRLRLIQQ